MASEPVITAAEMEKLTPNERARLVRESEQSSLDGLDPAFRLRVEATARRIAADYGLLDTEPS